MGSLSCGTSHVPSCGISRFRCHAACSFAARVPFCGASRVPPCGALRKHPLILFLLALQPGAHLARIVIGLLVKNIRERRNTAGIRRSSHIGSLSRGTSRIRCHAACTLLLLCEVFLIIHRILPHGVPGKFQNARGDPADKIAVVRHEQHRPLVLAQHLL